MNPFGQNNYNSSNSFTKRKRFKLKDGDNVYRILPAMGDLAEEGRWSAYHNIIFGFKNSEGKHRPFESPLVEDRKTKKVSIPCAATAMIRGLKAKMETAKKNGDSETAAQLAKIVGDYPVMGVYSINSDHYVNVVDLQGNAGQLELGHGAFLALKNEINRIRDTEGFDPLSADNGRFFNIRRTGKGRDTQYPTTVVKEKVDVPGISKKMETDIIHVIDNALLGRLITQKDGKWIYKEAADLTKLFKCPTSEEVELIVKNVDILSGKSSGIDAVFPKNQSTSATESSDADQETVEEAATSLPTDEKTGLQGKINNSYSGSSSGHGLTTNVTAAAKKDKEAESSVVNETKAAVKAAETSSTSNTPKTTAEAVAAMSPDEFMKKFDISV